MTDRDIARACQRHGAHRVYQAACRFASGDGTALTEVSLPDARGACAAALIARIAFQYMNAGDRAGDLARVAIDAARQRQAGR